MRKMELVREMWRENCFEKSGKMVWNEIHLKCYLSLCLNLRVYQKKAEKAKIQKLNST